MKLLWQNRRTGRWFLTPTGSDVVRRKRGGAALRAFIIAEGVIHTYPRDDTNGPGYSRAFDSSDALIRLAYAALTAPTPPAPADTSPSTPDSAD